MHNCKIYNGNHDAHKNHIFKHFYYAREVISLNITTLERGHKSWANLNWNNRTSHFGWDCLRLQNLRAEIMHILSDLSGPCRKTYNHRSTTQNAVRLYGRTPRCAVSGSFVSICIVSDTSFAPASTESLRPPRFRAEQLYFCQHLCRNFTASIKMKMLKEVGNPGRHKRKWGNFLLFLSLFGSRWYILLPGRWAPGLCPVTSSFTLLCSCPPVPHHHPLLPF